MALKKELEVNESGITAEYSKISAVKIEANRGELIVIMDLYANQVKRDEGKKPISNITVNFNMETIGSSVLELLYNEIKKLAEFEGSTDV